MLQMRVNEWRTLPLAEINAGEADGELDSFKRCFVKQERYLRSIHALEPLRALGTVSEELDSFREKEWLLMELMCTKAIRERHWNEMSMATGLDLVFPKEKKACVTDLVQLGLHEEELRGKCEEICQNAAREYSLEKALEGMEKEWEEQVFETKEHRDTGTHILRSVEEIQTLLDDQIMKTEAMKASRFAKPMEGRIQAWEKDLRQLNAIIENWMAVQSVWLYLEPIFSSEDICSQMPVEAMRFEVVDGTWRSGMESCRENPEVMSVAKNSKLLDSLEESRELLDSIQSGLNDYLEKKRLFFPRAFFLSNDELLEILAETKDPLRVQPHLKKCFEGIKSLDFKESLDIAGMISSEGEHVTFPYKHINEASAINPQQANGLVERWLVDVERVMRKSVARCIDEAMEDYLVPGMQRTDWLLKWPGQVVLCVTQIFWTREITSALSSRHENKSASLAKLSEKCTEQVTDIVLLVRGNLSKLARKTISPLIVLDVHGRDVIDQMILDGVHTVSDFGWASQLRYYYRNGGESARTARPASVNCRMINAQRMYANEYLGNSMRLVITPLTDRCYRTLMGAIHLNFGGAPEGPAGTGKTETVKDLGKAVSVQCVVYNCSDSLDYKAMGKFFKGLAGTGAWSCFDEFNRIELEVLSVVAQQILTIQRAKSVWQGQL